LEIAQSIVFPRHEEVTTTRNIATVMAGTSIADRFGERIARPLSRQCVQGEMA